MTFAFLVKGDFSKYRPSSPKTRPALVPQSRRGCRGYLCGPVWPCRQVRGPMSTPPQPAAIQGSFPVPGTPWALIPLSGHSAQAKVRGAGISDQSGSPAQRDAPTHPEQGAFSSPRLRAPTPKSPDPALGGCLQRQTLELGHGAPHNQKGLVHQVLLTGPRPPPPTSCGQSRSLPTFPAWAQLAAPGRSLRESSRRRAHSWGEGSLGASRLRLQFSRKRR